MMQISLTLRHIGIILACYVDTNKLVISVCADQFY